MTKIREGLCFDDVLLVPQHSKIASRSQIDTTVKLGKLQFKHPIIPANMSSVTGYEMALEVANSGGLAILHRFMPLEEQLEIVNKLISLTTKETPNYVDHVGVSVGVQDKDYQNVKDFYSLDIRIFCIDIAHGDSQHCVKMTQFISQSFPDVFLIAGNVATGHGARRLWQAGADAVKIGVGSGSTCSTRIETGNGIPQLTALMDAYLVKEELTSIKEGVYNPPTINKPIYIISDGGIKSAGDVVKALCFADMVMIGNLFAGCAETPGEVHIVNGAPCKEYRGSSTHKTNHVEGVVAWVPCTDKYINVLAKLIDGLCSGCSYQGANSLQELKDSPVFIKITSAGLRESHPHDVLKQ